MSVETDLDVSEQLLVGSRWSLSEKDRAPWSTTFYFSKDGTIGGYKSPNEVYWRLENAVLRILTETHQEMWRFSDSKLVNGLAVAVARLSAEPTSPLICQLTEIEKRIEAVPTENLLIGSRWSLGEEGKMPWSTSLYFRAGGTIGGYQSPNEAYWTLEDSVLRIYTESHTEMWRFEAFDDVDGRLSSSGTRWRDQRAESFCILREVEKSPSVVVTRDDLIGVRWTVGEEDKTPWSTDFYFLSDGRIGSYQSPNEVFWNLENSVLRVFTETMKVMWRFDRFYLVDGALHSHGIFQREPSAQNPCLLIETRSESLPSEEQLLTSRWSLGEEGRSPWSTSLYFRPHGRIGGYKSPNEVFWKLKASALEIYTETGEKMWRFEQFDSGSGGLQSIGSFKKEKGIELSCVLSELAADNLPTVEKLIATRWSLGQEGGAPWSTSFYFRSDGRVGGYKSTNEVHWSLKGSVLRIFDIDNREMWRFEGFELAGNGSLRAIGSFQREPGINFSCILTEMPALASATSSASQPTRPVEQASGAEGSEQADGQVKLLIWDLDDTFWSGTLAEGEIKERASMTQLVKTMAGRGILNSVCSKNNYDQARARLLAFGVWDYFIFPKIRFAPKGMMIRDLIESCQLRAPSVLFIDDNAININEALHYNPGLQVCGPEDIENLLDDDRCRGKADPDLVRLARYKILERKELDRKSDESENIDFLRQSEIRISFHEDVESVFPRIHDLINRTNQLNFTKNRWPEDEAEALGVFRREAGAHFDSQLGYIKVSDRYGKYGICGFFLIRNGDCHHFTFSCRALNMGIEQFVWQRLGRPYVAIRGEVVSTLGDEPDWIAVVEDADLNRETIDTQTDVSICVRGACDLAMMTHYLRMRFQTTEEFTFPYLGWGIHSCARAVALHDDLTLPANKELIDRLPGMPGRRFESAINSANCDIYVLSFSSEFFGGLYRSKTTGMILPFDFLPLGGAPAWKKDFRAVDYDTIRNEPLNGNITSAQWQMLQNEFEYVGGFQEGLFRRDVRTIFEKLQGKVVIVLMLNTAIGADKWILSGFATVNNVVRPLAEEFGYQTLEMSDFVRSADDLVTPDDGGVHFGRNVYQNLAKKVAEIVAAQEVVARTPIASFA